MPASDIPKAVKSFANEVGDSGPVAVLGGGTHSRSLDAEWQNADQQSSGRPEPSEVRQLRAPSGVWEYEPSEMTVRCGAGTTLAELSETLASHQQMVPFDAKPDATVGGVLAVGQNGFRRLRYGHVRDFVLQTRHVDHTGQVVTAGGPTVKNVSGYDLCRLLVGSSGTLGFLAEVILRCVPIPPTVQWLTASEADPFEVHQRLYRPSSILWDGRTTWVLLEGHSTDVASESAKLTEFAAVDPPTDLLEFVQNSLRVSLRPSELPGFASKQLSSHEDPNAGRWVAEVGVGLVHYTNPGGFANPTETNPTELANPSNINPTNTALMDELKRRLDPTGRLNPGLRPW